MRHLFISFKTKVSPTLSLTKMAMPDYIAATDVVCLGLCVDQDPVVSFPFPFDQSLLDAVATIQSEPHAIFAHNIGFHKAVWQKLGWPEPAEWCCTMAALKREEPGAKKYAMKAVAERHGLPPRIEVDEMGLNGRCTNDLLRAVERDAALVRAISETILKRPLTEIV